MANQANKPKAKYQRVGQILKGKDGAPNYIKMDQDVKAGTFINIEDPRTLPDTLLAAGKIKQEVYEKMKARNIPDFVVRELTAKVSE